LIAEADWELAHARRVGALVFAAEEAGLDVETEVAREAFDAAWGWHMDEWVRGVATGAPEIAREALRLLGLERVADADRASRALEDLIHDWQEASHTSRVHAIEGARETLAALAQAGVRRALVCDTGLTPGRVVRAHLAREGLLEHLEVCVFSDEVGAPKPDPRTFRAALEPLGAAPARCIHVGDLLRTDVAGARSVGMGTVRIRAAHDDPSELPEADAIVDSHAELRRLLGVG
ncbi:MAG: HAD family hydrolase, partial [Myxococcota bacterium]|nr:HAD family hydrolase [Myxococcota bacterium]